MSKQRIRIRLKAFDYALLDDSAEKIVQIARQTGAHISGPVPLPTEKNVWCVNRSPFVAKKSREHFEIRTHKRLIDIYFDQSQKTIEQLMKVDLPAGVDIEIRS